MSQRDRTTNAAITHESWCGLPLGVGCTCQGAPAACDRCGERAWCELTTWKDGCVIANGFLCDACRQSIPNDERGWGRDA